MNPGSPGIDSHNANRAYLVLGTPPPPPFFHQLHRGSHPISGFANFGSHRIEKRTAAATSSVRASVARTMGTGEVASFSSPLCFRFGLERPESLQTLTLARSSAAWPWRRRVSRRPAGAQPWLILSRPILSQRSRLENNVSVPDLLKSTCGFW